MKQIKHRINQVRNNLITKQEFKELLNKQGYKVLSFNPQHVVIKDLRNPGMITTFTTMF